MRPRIYPVAVLRNAKDGCLQRMVRTVTKRRVFGVFTSAQMDVLVFFGGESDRCERGAFVGAVAERLAAAAAAGAPIIGLAFFDIDGVGKFLRDFRFFCYNDKLPFQFWVSLPDDGRRALVRPTA